MVPHQSSSHICDQGPDIRSSPIPDNALFAQHSELACDIAAPIVAHANAVCAAVAEDCLQEGRCSTIVGDD